MAYVKAVIRYRQQERVMYMREFRLGIVGALTEKGWSAFDEYTKALESGDSGG